MEFVGEGVEVGGKDGLGCGFAGFGKGEVKGDGEDGVFDQMEGFVNYKLVGKGTADTGTGTAGEEEN